MDHQPVHHRPAGAQMLPSTTTALSPYGRGRQQGSLLAISRLMRQLRTPRNDVVRNRASGAPGTIRTSDPQIRRLLRVFDFIWFFCKAPNSSIPADRA
jgi:hypothetical protein